jgi:hypothetical protein
LFRNFVSFLPRLRALVRLRYRLIWAFARSSNGKIALLFTVYLLLAMLALILSLGGFSMAIVTIEAGGGELVARYVLTGIFIQGFLLSSFFGLAPNQAFTEYALRRYPLNASERFFTRHLLGALDPIWVILFAFSLGLLAGFVSQQPGLTFTGLPGVILFTITSYLATAVLMAIIGIITQHRAGAAILGSFLLLVVSFMPLLLVSLDDQVKFELSQILDLVLQYSPSGAAAAMIAGRSLTRILGGAALLLFWCGFFFSFLKWVDQRRRSRQVKAKAEIEWDSKYDRIGKMFGIKYGPLIGKSLRYHLRCNSIRFGLVTSPLIIFCGKLFYPGHSDEQFFIISLGLFFMLNSANGGILLLNLFGFDDAGIRRYPVLPIRFADALRAGSIASLVVRATVFLISLLLWLIVNHHQTITWRMILMLLSVALASLFLYNALGLWTSIYSPRRLNFDAIWNNRLSAAVTILMTCGILIPLFGIMFFARLINPALVPEFWWIALGLLFLSAGFFAFTLWAIEIPANGRREALINIIAGAHDNHDN